MSKKNSCALFSLIGMLFVFCCVTERELAINGNIVWDGRWIAKLLAVCILGGILGGSIICLGLLKLEKEWIIRRSVATCNAAEKQLITEKKRRSLPRAGVLFWLSWGGIMLCWLPGFLAYYPCICTYDFGNQMGQIMSQSYNDHHPIFHTLLMGFFIRVGDSWGSGNWGLAMYVLFQMFLLSAVLASGIAFLRKKAVKNCLLVLLHVVCCIFPFHWYMSISATKDTIFAALFVLQILFLCEMLSQKSKKVKFNLWDVGYLLASGGMILFRNNGRYAMAVMSVILGLVLIFGKKERLFWGKLLTETVLGIFVGSILLTAVFSFTGAEQGDRREMLCMPIQQLARVMVYHGGVGIIQDDDNTISDKDKALINDFILDEGYKKYRADIADPVKSNTNTYVFAYRIKDFLSTYLHLFTQYPGDYLNAALAVNAGYLSPFDESHAYINVSDSLTGLGYIQTRGVQLDPNPFEIRPDSKCPWLYEKMENFADSNAYKDITVFKYLLVPGTYLWLYLILAAWLIIHKKYRLLVPLSLVLGYYVTLLLGPTVQMRYIYPLMIMLPYVTIWCLNDIKREALSDC